MTAGRPSDYDPAYCDRVIELGKDGASVAEMAFEIGTTKQTMHAWAAAHPEFLDAFTRGKLASQVWWERKGKTNLENTSFKDGMWSRSMAARFPDDWREIKGTELTGKDGGPVETKATIDASKLTDEQLRALASIPVHTD